MKQQDSEDPTGVSGNGDGGKSMTRARDRKANAGVQMALAGASWDEIAKALGYPTARAARVSIEIALEKRYITDEDRAKMRKIAGARLQRLLRATWSKAIDPESPEQLAAVREARATIADHRKLYGLDAPSEVIVHNPTREELEDWVTRLVSVSTPPVQEYDIIAGEVVDDAVPSE